jgi:YD repeat-containing protein
LDPFKRHFESLPSGAVSWEKVYLDDRGNPTKNENATGFIISEYDEQGELLREHFGVKIK